MSSRYSVPRGKTAALVLLSVFLVFFTFASVLRSGEGWPILVASWPILAYGWHETLLLDVNRLELVDGTLNWRTLGRSGSVALSEIGEIRYPRRSLIAAIFVLKDRGKLYVPITKGFARFMADVVAAEPRLRDDVRRLPTFMERAPVPNGYTRSG